MYAIIGVVTFYLYGSLDSDIYIRIPYGFKMLEALILKSRNVFYQITKIIV